MNKILFITLSNLGDVILTLPVLDLLREKFPRAKITVVAGPPAGPLFQGNLTIDKLFIYHKRSALREKIRLFASLKRQKFDIVVDLRNTFMGFLIPAKYKTSPFLKIPKNIRHMKDRHFYRIKPLIRELGIEASGVIGPNTLYTKCADETYINQVLEKNNIRARDKMVVISPGARSHTKIWPADKFLALSELIIQGYGARVVLVGDSDDIFITGYIAEKLKNQALDLGGKTTLGQLRSLLIKSSLVITNDSAVLHMASYLNVPVVTIFGISDESKYGPWSQTGLVIKRSLSCRPCEKAQCGLGTLECIQAIEVKEVFAAVERILGANEA